LGFHYSFIIANYQWLISYITHRLLIEYQLMLLNNLDKAHILIGQMDYGFAHSFTLADENKRAI